MPLRVESALVGRGPLRVTVAGEGKTRVRERYQVLAPLGGRMARITLRPGDRVEKDAVVTVIDPVAPPLLDVRTRAEAEARVRTAEASLVRATAAVEVARVAVETAGDGGRAAAAPGVARGGGACAARRGRGGVQAARRRAGGVAGGGRGGPLSARGGAGVPPRVSGRRAGGKG